MSKTPKRPRKAAPKSQPSDKEQLSQEQLDQVSGGIIINWRDTTTEVREAARDSGLGGSDTKLGPEPHLGNPKLGQ